MSGAQIAANPARANESILLREDLNGICVLTLNRPEARNALSEGMLSDLTQTLAAIAKTDSVRAVVLAANGPAFCAGHDLREMTARRSDADQGRAYFEQIWEMCSALMQTMMRLPQPVIAAVHGAATGAGCQLVATCDLAVASSIATFSTPGVQIGLFCSMPMVPLSRNLSRKHAMEMLLTGERIDADEAMRFGLVNCVVTEGAERAEAIKLGRQIASKSAMTLRMGKEAFYRQLEMGLSEAYRYAGGVMVDNMLKRDAIEGIGAFLDKRPAQWEDR
jgi:enoyl-CoA hydratase/carnithine racemase